MTRVALSGCSNEGKINTGEEVSGWGGRRILPRGCVSQRIWGELGLSCITVLESVTGRSYCGIWNGPRCLPCRAEIPETPIVGEGMCSLMTMVASDCVCVSEAV